MFLFIFLSFFVLVEKLSDSEVWKMSCIRFEIEACSPIFTLYTFASDSSEPAMHLFFDLWVFIELCIPFSIWALWEFFFVSENLFYFAT